MEYVNVGRTGLRVSRLCLGMMSYGPHESRQWALPESDAEPIVRAAVEGGINFFDTADTYNGGQSEVITGKLLRSLFGMREEYVLATKVFMPTMPGENGHGPVAQAHHGLDRRLPRAARPRLRRPLPDPPLGSSDTDRGDDGGPARCRQGGQGSVHRRQQHVRVAVRQGPASGLHARSSPCRTTTT